MNTIIPIEMYHTQIDLRVVKSVNSCIRGIIRKHKKKYKIEGESYGMVWHCMSDKYYLVLERDSLTHGIIAHEVEHIRAYITEYAGSTEIDGGYLVQYITDKVYAFLEMRNIKVSSGRNHEN